MCSDGGNRGTSLLQRIKHRVGEELSVPPRTAKERFRHELKYLISYAQKADLNVRMAEVYLIAAEASVRLNKGDAAKYINVLRTRAGAGTVSESQVDLNYIFDEYARELCGECGRWYLLKRNAAFETRLAAYNKRAAEHFKKEFYLRPIPTKYLDAINNPAEFGQNAGY